MNLQGKTVLITGGARRLGLAMAEAVASRGANIAVHYRSSSPEAQKAVHLLSQYQVQAAAFQADLMNGRDIRDMISAVAQQFGTLDVLINNAAVFERKPFLELTEDDWDQTLDTNLKAPFLCARAAGEIMLRQGSGKIVNLACVGGVRPWANYIPYCVSKAGLIMLTEALARALAPHVQVNAIAPGKIEFKVQSSKFKVQTQEFESAVNETDDGQRAAGSGQQTTSVPNGTPQDITRALLYLLDSDYVTGETLLVDGGRHLK